MFVYSFKASTVRILGVVCIALVGIIALVAFVPTYVTAGNTDTPTMQVDSESVSIKYDKIKTEQDVVAFLEQFGWQVEEQTAKSTVLTIPGEFDKVLTGYNEIQKRQGLDLSKYKKKNVTRYTYKITNYDGYDGTVYANILVYRNKVVGGDVCSADVKGFMHGLSR